MELADTLRHVIRTIPDFPKSGIAFKDISPVLQDPDLTRRVVRALGTLFDPDSFDVVGGVEARGFILGALVAYELGRPFFPLRKPGKLPGRVERESYALEYGEATLEMHADAICSGTRVLLVDDLLATGGTVAAAARLVERCGGTVTGVAFLVELDFLPGRPTLRAAGLDDARVRGLVHFGAGE